MLGHWKWVIIVCTYELSNVSGLLRVCIATLPPLTHKTHFSLNLNVNVAGRLSLAPIVPRNLFWTRKFKNRILSLSRHSNVLWA